MSCSAGLSLTEDRMRAYGAVLNAYYPGGAGSGPEFPRRLSDLDPGIRGQLARTDEWGNDFYYRRIDLDNYQLISRGPNGTLGDRDDVIYANGLFYEPDKIYSERPIEGGQ